MKKYLSLVIICFLLFTVIGRAEISEVQVKVNGKLIEFDVKPLINEDDRTLVPIRFIAENLGAKVGWNQDLKEVTITKDNKTIKLKIGEKKANVNNEVIKFDTKAILEDGRTLVPVRFISETLGVTVDWNNKTRTVLIGDKNTIESENKIVVEGQEFEAYPVIVHFYKDNMKLIKKNEDKYLLSINKDMLEEFGSYQFRYNEEGNPAVFNYDILAQIYLHDEKYGSLAGITLFSEADESCKEELKNIVKGMYPQSYEEIVETMFKYKKNKKGFQEKIMEGKYTRIKYFDNGSVSLYVEREGFR